MSKCVICESLAGSDRPVLPHDMADLVRDDRMTRRRATLFLDHTTPDWRWFNMIAFCDACQKRLYVTHLLLAGVFEGEGEAGELKRMLDASRAGMLDEEALKLGTPAVATRCKSKPCGEVIYLPTAPPRPRTRPKGEGAAPGAI